MTDSGSLDRKKVSIHNFLIWALQLVDNVVSGNNEFPQYAEKILGLEANDKETTNSQANNPLKVSWWLLPDLTFLIQAIPSINSCSTDQELAELHHKIVKFECQIVDQYEDEFFVSVIDPLEQTTSNKNPLVYKYFSELTTD